MNTELNRMEQGITIEVVLPPSISRKQGEMVVPVETGSGSVKELFRRFFEMHPRLAEELAGENGEPLPHLLVSLDDKLVRREEWGGTVLKDRDRLYLFFALSGG